MRIYPTAGLVVEIKECLSVKIGLEFWGASVATQGLSQLHPDSEAFPSVTATAHVGPIRVRYVA